MSRITTSECADAEETICCGCAKEHAFEVDGIGCEINFQAEVYGIVPPEWDVDAMTCSGYEAGGAS